MNSIFDRTSLGTMKLRNRVFMSPMGTGTDPDGGHSEQSRLYYTERAKGGFGLIILGATTCSTKYEPKPCNVLDSMPMVERLQRVVESIHSYGAKTVLQISAGLGRMTFTDGSVRPYAPSEVPGTYFPDVLCRPYSKEQIADLVDSFGNCAMWAKSAGCDGIMLQAYGGYLIDQFMCSLWNKRTDEYGGSLENRMRFPLELIADVQKKCGKDFPIMAKFTLTHHLEGGRTVEEGLEVAKIFERAGVCELHVDQGCFEKWYIPIPTVYNDFGTKLDLAAKVKEVVSIPVSCDGKLDDPQTAMRAIAEGKVDYVSLGKQSIADPAWPNKVKHGELDDIRYCIGCNECLLGILYGRLVQCAVNPTVGFENFGEPEPAKEPKNVLVIGGGLGGMQCALTAAQRGHRVTIWEKELRLGGLGNAAGEPAFKESVARYVQYLRNQVLKQPNINVVYNMEATVEKVSAFAPDKVVLATGAVSSFPPIPGLKDNAKAAAATDYLLGKAEAKGNVVVIGGGLVGSEAALDVVDKGGKAVIVEALDKLVPKDIINDNNRMMLNRLISEKNVRVCCNAKVEKIGANSVTISTANGSEELPYDAVLVATGMKSNNALESKLYELYDENVFVIGDADHPAKIMDAVHTGYHVAKNML